MPTYGIVLVLSGYALLGLSLVLLVKSPFRMSPTERLYRIVWLGPVGRGFVWLSARGVRAGVSPVRRARATPSVAVTGPRAVASPVVSVSVPAAPPPVTLEMLDVRVSDLERWRRRAED